VRRGKHLRRHRAPVRPPRGARRETEGDRRDMEDADSSKEVTRRDLLRDAAGVFLLGFGYNRRSPDDRGRDRRVVWARSIRTPASPAIAAPRAACSRSPRSSACTASHVRLLRAVNGYFEPQPNALKPAPRNQLCPTGAIRRTFVEDPYYQYEDPGALCIGCRQVRQGCTAFGNGSLHMQVRHDRWTATSAPSPGLPRRPVSQGPCGRPTDEGQSEAT